MNTNLSSNNLSVQKYQKNWLGYSLLGFVLMVLGILGAIYSVSVTAVAMLWLGILITIAGLFQCIYSFYAERWQARILQLILGFVTIAVGIFLIAYPLHASVVFTLIIGCFLILMGLARIVFAFTVKQYAVWWLILIAGIISLVLGILVLAHWPVSGLWIIGFFISLEVLLAGFSMLLTALAVKMAA